MYLTYREIHRTLHKILPYHLLSTGTREVSLMFHKPGYGTVFAGYGAFEFCFLLLLAFQFLFCLVSHLRQHSSEEERMSVAEAQR